MKKFMNKLKISLLLTSVVCLFSNNVYLMESDDDPEGVLYLVSQREVVGKGADKANKMIRTARKIKKRTTKNICTDGKWADAIKRGNTKKIKSLCNVYGDINRFSQRGYSNPLLCAAATGNSEYLKKVLKGENLDIYVKDDYGQTVLHKFVQGNSKAHRKCFFLFMGYCKKQKLPLDFTIKDKGDNTLFHEAAKRNHISWICRLMRLCSRKLFPLDYAGLLFLCNKKGQTPYDIAVERNHSTIVRILEEEMVRRLKPKVEELKKQVDRVCEEMANFSFKKSDKERDEESYEELYSSQEERDEESYEKSCEEDDEELYSSQEESDSDEIKWDEEYSKWDEEYSKWLAGFSENEDESEESSVEDLGEYSQRILKTVLVKMYKKDQSRDIMKKIPFKKKNS